MAIEWGAAAFRGIDNYIVQWHCYVGEIEVKVFLKSEQWGYYDLNYFDKFGPCASLEAAQHAAVLNAYEQVYRAYLKAQDTECAIRQHVSAEVVREVNERVWKEMGYDA